MHRVCTDHVGVVVAGAEGARPDVSFWQVRDHQWFAGVVTLLAVVVTVTAIVNVNVNVNVVVQENYCLKTEGPREVGQGVPLWGENCTDHYHHQKGGYQHEQHPWKVDMG